MTGLTTRLKIWLTGTFVGSDAMGNRYYRDRRPDRYGRERRRVLYRGEVEASRVPAAWHGWLHHMTDAVPDESTPRHPWQKPHQPNLTGTPAAYRPPGSLLKGGQRPRATGDYDPWIPE